MAWTRHDYWKTGDWALLLCKQLEMGWLDANRAQLFVTGMTRQLVLFHGSPSRVFFPTETEWSTFGTDWSTFGTDWRDEEADLWRGPKTMTGKSFQGWPALPEYVGTPRLLHRESMDALRLLRKICKV